MAKVAPTVEERDANLDALQEALDEWVETETTRLDNETKFLRSVLEGRGASDLGTTNLRETSSLTQTAISEFTGVETEETTL